MPGKRILIETALFCTALAAVIFVLLIPPPVGIADNGDFPKMIGRFALVAEPASANDAPGYVTIRYVRDPKAWWVSENYSTEIPLIRMALAISDWMNPGYFDIRLIGAIHGAIYLSSFAGLLLVILEMIERQWKEWRPQGDSNPCYRRERAVS